MGHLADCRGCGRKINAPLHRYDYPTPWKLYISNFLYPHISIGINLNQFSISFTYPFIVLLLLYIPIPSFLFVNFINYLFVSPLLSLSYIYKYILLTWLYTYVSVSLLMIIYFVKACLRLLHLIQANSIRYQILLPQ